MVEHICDYLQNQGISSLYSAADLESFGAVDAHYRWGFEFITAKQWYWAGLPRYAREGPLAYCRLRITPSRNAVLARGSEDINNMPEEAQRVAEETASSTLAAEGNTKKRPAEEHQEDNGRNKKERKSEDNGRGQPTEKSTGRRQATEGNRQRGGQAEHDRQRRVPAEGKRQE